MKEQTFLRAIALIIKTVTPVITAVKRRGFLPLREIYYANLNPVVGSEDEALLLCQESESEWVAWIPDHGEAILHVSEFCLIPN